MRRKIGNDEFSIRKQVKGVCRKRHHHATSDGRADRFRELSRALASFREMHGYGAKVTFSEQGHFISASMPLFAKKRRFGAVFARLMNVTDRKYEVICTNGKIKGKHNGK